MGSSTISHDYLSARFLPGLLNERIDESDIVTFGAITLLKKKAGQD